MNKRNIHRNGGKNNVNPNVDNMKKLLSFYASILALISGTLAIYLNLSKVLEEAGLPIEWSNPITYGVCILSLIVFFCSIYVYLREIGFITKFYNNDSASFHHLNNWFCNKKRNNLMSLQLDMQYKLSKFRDDIDEIKDYIKQLEKVITLNDKYIFFKDYFYELMKSVSVAFYSNFHHSISIGIYFLTEEGENTFLYCWMPFHEIETSFSNENAFQSEKYLIHSCRRKKELKDFALNAMNYFNQHDDEGYLKNSIFDYILTTPHNSWISNNIKEDIKKGEFYISGGNNNDEYRYNSLAVYAIAPPISGKRKNVKTMGLLTFESSAANAFAKEDSIIVLQSFSQIVYEALNEIQK